MFGYLRFFLAYLVLLSHIDIRFNGLNIGVFAVVIFYILAGYVVSHLYFDVLPKTRNRMFLFYKDRFLRIFPLYIYVIIITLLFLYMTDYGNPKYTIQNIVSNFIIIPLNYYMYIDTTILQKPSWCLVPPAWSLGAELQAYILLSFVLMFNKVRYIFAFFSFIIFIIAKFSILNPDYFGYRLLIGVFFIFIIGSSIQRIKLKIKLPFDSFLGSLSYGMFLSHFLAIWILNYLVIKKENDFYLFYLSSISISIAIIGIYLVENNILKYRKNILRIDKK